MDDGEHADASSSPNADRVDRIRRRGRDKLVVTLAGGGEFLISERFLADIGCAEGNEVNSHIVDRLSSAHRRTAASEKAVDLIARREHSVAGLRSKLIKRRFDADTVAAVCDELVACGYLDDRRFAERWLEDRIRRRHEGRARLLAGLSKAGVSRKTAAAAVEETLPEGYEERAFADAVSDLERRGVSESPRVARRLNALGFPPGMIRDYLERSRPEQP